MLYAICKHIRNFFPQSQTTGSFTIAEGTISLPLLEGQYFLIEGSILNDGVYRYPAEGLKDETFTGCITAMAVPSEFASLCEEIETYAKDNPSGAYVSESFGGYSYTKATDSKGNPVSWQDVFRARLNPWRKL